MSDRITDEMIDYIGILAKLELSKEEKEQAKLDMGNMLDYVDKLNELDTEGIEPLNMDLVQNVFREDTIGNGDMHESMLFNAPKQKDGCFQVPKTIE